MVDIKNFFKSIKNSPDKYFIIHYSSEHLFDEGLHGLSPRITSIVVMHYSTEQLQAFALHTSAEVLGISRDDVSSQYDRIEKDLLERFYSFVRDRRQMYWIHWNMRSQLFGFEHLEHRYRMLTGLDAPNIPVEVRLNLNDVLRHKYGPNYADHPQLKNLMLLQGELPRQFLEGMEESECFAKKEFIRMNASTICKVQFFHHVIRLAMKGKLKTKGIGLFYLIDRLLESRLARVLAFTASMAGFCYLLFRIFGFVRW